MDNWNVWNKRKVWNGVKREVDHLQEFRFATFATTWKATGSEDSSPPRSREAWSIACACKLSPNMWAWLTLLEVMILFFHFILLFTVSERFQKEKFHRSGLELPGFAGALSNRFESQGKGTNLQNCFALLGFQTLAKRVDFATRQGGWWQGSLGAQGVFQLVEWLHAILLYFSFCRNRCCEHNAASKRRQVAERSMPCIFSGTCCKRHLPEDSFARMRSLQNSASATAPLSWSQEHCTRWAAPWQYASSLYSWTVWRWSEMANSESCWWERDTGLTQMEVHVGEENTKILFLNCPHLDSEVGFSFLHVWGILRPCKLPNFATSVSESYRKRRNSWSVSSSWVRKRTPWGN